ncbi:MAG: 16S rRNA (cytosine(1402)-N(4))-methyltransferase RsmH [Chloroflexi bacterium]|nr:16S rRNA (cytosine(1402)-N(4))-methyltransferase RsmH [Chloroflexota bacterium]
MTQSPHIPIMVDEVLDGLQVVQRTNPIYIDGTLGAGGHSHAILSANDAAHVIAFDRDLDAIAIARQTLAPFADRVTIHHASYLEMGNLIIEPVDGILLDLGLSSMQVDDVARGFSFRHDAPLNMRFDPTSEDPTAAELLNGLPEEDIANIIFHYGEERQSRKIARVIVENRPIKTTKQLADLIADTIRGKPKIHPATLTFQALRIAVNRELEAVEAILPIAINLLKPGGRLAAITFHSLEDRIVKHTFKEEATDCICPPKQLVCTCGHKARVQLVNRKPITADEDEIDTNPRSRSAKLRIVERI